MLSACGKTAEGQKSEKPKLEVENTTWGMNVDETLKAFDLTKESASLFMRIQQERRLP